MGVLRKISKPNSSKNEYPCAYQEGKKCSFFGKFGGLCFLETPVLRFALLLYYRRTDTQKRAFRCVQNDIKKTFQEMQWRFSRGKQNVVCRLSRDDYFSAVIQLTLHPGENISQTKRQVVENGGTLNLFYYFSSVFTFFLKLF